MSDTTETKGDQANETPPADGDGRGNDGGETSPTDTSAKGFITRALDSSRLLITSAVAVAGALVTYDLATKLGEGELTPSEMRQIIASVVVFAAGVGILLTVPILMTAKSRATLTDAKRLERKRFGKETVEPAVLYGFRSVAEFSDALDEALRESYRFWSQGLKVPRRLQDTVELLDQQRMQAQDHVAANQLAEGARRAAAAGGFGMVLAVAGYAFATMITNQGIREAKVDDDRAVAGRELVKLIVQDQLAEDQPGGQVGFALPAEVVVTLPDADVAQTVIPAAEATTESCWKDRPALAYAVGQNPDTEYPARVVAVALPAAPGCSSLATQVEPAWFVATGDGATGRTADEAETEGGGSTTTTTAAAGG